MSKTKWHSDVQAQLKAVFPTIELERSFTLTDGSRYQPDGYLEKTIVFEAETFWDRAKIFDDFCCTAIIGVPILVYFFSNLKKIWTAEQRANSMLSLISDLENALLSTSHKSFSNPTQRSKRYAR